MKAKKRYIITHVSAEIDNSAVAESLGKSIDNVQSGVEFMATESTPGADDVLVFSSIGISSAELTEKEAQSINAQDDILAVEEDVTMSILGFSSEEQVQDYNEIFSQAPSTPVASTNPWNNLNIRFTNEGLLLSFPSSAGQGGTEAEAAATSQPIPWNISMVNAPAAWARGITGKGIKLAIIDTGIALNHPDLIPVSGGICFVPGRTSYDDDNGHGTHCAGIAAARNNSIGVVGVAPNANLYAVKVLAANGSGSSSAVIAGMDWAASNGMDVASMSLGSPSDPSVAYATAVKRMQDKGVFVATASGNAFVSAFPWVGSPANSIMAGQPNASPLAVGAVDRSRVIASFSSRGAKAGIAWNQVGIVAPGVSIYSTWPPNTYNTLSGTSMATPHVAGAGALMKQRFPGIAPAALKGHMMLAATPLGDRTAYGSGLLDCDKATR